MLKFQTKRSAYAQVISVSQVLRLLTAVNVHFQAFFILLDLYNVRDLALNGSDRDYSKVVWVVWQV